MRFLTLVFPAIVVASAVPAFAHHGGGTFDLTKSVTYNGTLTKVVPCYGTFCSAKCGG